MRVLTRPPTMETGSPLFPKAQEREQWPDLGRTETESGQTLA